MRQRSQLAARFRLALRTLRLAYHSDMHARHIGKVLFLAPINDCSVEQATQTSFGFEMSLNRGVAFRRDRSTSSQICAPTRLALA
jgi:hypothetical protein